jgi:hypothetical protein
VKDFDFAYGLRIIGRQHIGQQKDGLIKSKERQLHDGSGHS